MKHLSLLMCAAFLAIAAPVQQARADVSVSVEFFFDALSPYGDWIYADNYGYVWQPPQANIPEWSPYTDGYWAYTDAGWTWISNEPFGWATYHYGRWTRMYGRWVWVPGNEWAPAWVSWRQADDCVGWAPLPPEARWSVSIGFSRWTDSYYDVGPGCYSFVPFHAFGTRTSLRQFIFERSRNAVFVDRSVNITNITYQQNVVNNIFVGGPDPARIDRFSPTPVRRLTLRRDEDTFRRDWLDNPGAPRRDFRSLSRIDRDQLVVAAPSIRRDERPVLPPVVRERFERPEIDRGWRGIGDAGLAERLRSRQRDELAQTRPDRLPEKAPVLVTSKLPPPALGRPLRVDERRGGPGGPPPGRDAEEVRKATPMPPAVRPPEVTRPSSPPRVIDQPPSLPGGDRRPGLPGMPGFPPGARLPESPVTRSVPWRVPGYDSGRRGGAPTMPTPPRVTLPEPPKTRPVPTPESRPPGRPTMPQTREAPAIKPPAMPSRPSAPVVRPPTLTPPRSAPPVVKPPATVRPSMPERRVEPPATRMRPAGLPTPRPQAPPQTRSAPPPAARPAPVIKPPPAAAPRMAPPQARPPAAAPQRPGGPRNEERRQR